MKYCYLCACTSINGCRALFLLLSIFQIEYQFYFLFTFKSDELILTAEYEYIRGY